jgi:hypothetical protein
MHGPGPGAAAAARRRPRRRRPAGTGEESGQGWAPTGPGGLGWAVSGGWWAGDGGPAWAGAQRRRSGRAGGRGCRRRGRSVSRPSESAPAPSPLASDRSGGGARRRATPAGAAGPTNPSRPAPPPNAPGPPFGRGWSRPSRRLGWQGGWDLERQAPRRLQSRAASTCAHSPSVRVRARARAGPRVGVPARVRGGRRHAPLSRSQRPPAVRLWPALTSAQTQPVAARGVHAKATMASLPDPGRACFSSERFPVPLQNGTHGRGRDGTGGPNR